MERNRYQGETRCSQEIRVCQHAERPGTTRVWRSDRNDVVNDVWQFTKTLALVSLLSANAHLKLLQRPIASLPRE